MNILAFSNNKIALIKVQEKSISQGYCDAGTSQILSVTNDLVNTGTIYASTTRGEILMFETYTKGDVQECRVKGRLYTKYADT